MTVHARDLSLRKRTPPHDIPERLSPDAIRNEEMRVWKAHLVAEDYDALPSENRDEQLRFAIMNGFTEGAVAILEQGASPTNPASGLTPIYLAADAGNLVVCQKLIDLGADLEARTSEGTSPLCAAAKHGHAKVCELLLECGADVTNAGAASHQPLRYAIFSGNVATCSVLLHAGADPAFIPNAPPTPYLTPFQAGVSASTREVATFLIDSYPALLYVKTLAGQDMVKLTAGRKNFPIVRSAMLTDAIAAAVDATLDSQQPVRKAKGFSPL